VTTLLQLAAALYLAAGVAGAVGVSLGSRRTGRMAIGLLAAGALCHAGSFVALHGADPVPPLTELPMAVSFMAFVMVATFLVFARRVALGSLAVLLGPLAFLGAFFSGLGEIAPDPVAASGAWPHAHVLLAGAGLSLLAVAAVAGAVYLMENRRLKRKQLHPGPGGLPSLETLDRVNAVALAVGFPLLTLGVLTGMMWANGAYGSVFTGSAHEAWNAIAWIIYGVLVAARFVADQGARDAAASAVGGFAFLLFAVVGVGILA
jgi:ABC-type transport system involved in cytochrome c biogenesis permease subunit